MQQAAVDGAIGARNIGIEASGAGVPSGVVVRCCWLRVGARDFYRAAAGGGAGDETQGDDS